ncbi:hypothetical protein DPMN_162651 [Dreissena polymorpha]|uniref:Uncharacterized protein n=1 Tax=Dreissena polymorpha TaxID=45954 RepID=A0A9D4ITX9_DREPO|nr:hypothetical protein DPMN_162651 [Dreissena polymorpha]
MLHSELGGAQWNRSSTAQSSLRKHLQQQRELFHTLMWTRNQARLSVQDCFSGQARGRSTSRPSEIKLDGQFKRVDIPSHV